MIYNREKLKSEFLNDIKEHLKKVKHRKVQEGNISMRQHLLNRLDKFQKDPEKWCDDRITELKNFKMSRMR